jgi:hypothetical protein
MQAEAEVETGGPSAAPPVAEEEADEDLDLSEIPAEGVEEGGGASPCRPCVHRGCAGLVRASLHTTSRVFPRWRNASLTQGPATAPPFAPSLSGGTQWRVFFGVVWGGGCGVAARHLTFLRPSLLPPRTQCVRLCSVLRAAVSVACCPRWFPSLPRQPLFFCSTPAFCCSPPFHPPLWFFGLGWPCCGTIFRGRRFGCNSPP